MTTWLEENKRYKEFLINRYLLCEADRTRFIKDNFNLTDDQKQEIIDTFKRFPNADKDIKWGSKDVSSWTYDKFKPYIDDTKKSKRQLTKNELSDLVEGKDYNIAKKYEDGTISYEILTYKASVVIASNQVKPDVWTPLSYWSCNRDTVGLKAFPFGRPQNPRVVKVTRNVMFPGAKWCTAMQTSDEHWIYYTKEEGLKLVYIVSSNQGRTEYKKIAVAYKPETGKYKMFNSYDEEFDIEHLKDDKVKIYIEDALSYLKNK